MSNYFSCMFLHICVVENLFCTDFQMVNIPIHWYGALFRGKQSSLNMNRSQAKYCQNLLPNFKLLLNHLQQTPLKRYGSILLLKMSLFVQGAQSVSSALPPEGIPLGLLPGSKLVCTAFVCCTTGLNFRCSSV